MKTKNLLSKLSSLEVMLNDFSFEELSTTEAVHLKKSFESFKKKLEKSVFEKPDVSIQTGDKQFQKAMGSFDKTEKNDSDMLIAKVSHEMRTPLNGIIGFADLLKESNLTDAQREHVSAIESASHGLMEIINELLEYSKLSAGLEHFESVDFNFYGVIRDVMYLCNMLLTEKKVELAADIDPDIPEVLVGDPSKLTQVLLNLLGNAIKFVEEGKIHLEVLLKKQKGDSYLLEFKVIDTGIGIAEEHLEYIFDTFKQAGQDYLANQGGYGLGLSIVKQIIEKSGGSIKVFSSLGIGTTFEFTLPYKKGDIMHIVKPKNNSSETSKKEEVVKGMRVLVFEDNLLNQRLIEQRLKIWKCKTYITENAMYGLNVLKENEIDVVLMDLRMPDMSGFEVTERIRNSEDEKINQVPVIALSADYSAQDKKKCETFGINDFILKPYTPEELLSKLSCYASYSEISGKEHKKSEKLGLRHQESAKLDLKHLLEECRGEMEMLEELVFLYKQNALEFMGSTKFFIQNGDFENLKFAAHKIKCGLVMIKNEELHDLILEIHNICTGSKDIEQLGLLYDQFIKAYSKTEKALDEALEELKNGRNWK